MSSARMKSIFLDEQRAVEQTYGTADGNVVQMIAFTRSCGKALCVHSGKQAVELFVAR
jgi:hypothetical protein